MPSTQLPRTAWIALPLLLLLAGYYSWQRYGGNGEADGVAASNGRIEATEIDIAAKAAGRISEILVHEGEFISAGQVVARLDSATLKAQLRQAKAQLGQAHSAVETARSQLAQAESEKAAAQAVVLQREAEYEAARKQAARSQELTTKGAISEQVADNDRAQMLSAEAGVSAARAQVAASEAGIVTARAQISGAQAEIEAVEAAIDSIQTEIDETELKSPRDGRVQYLVAQVGEVVAAGGRVLNVVDLSDVYMTFFLPTAEAGRVALGSEARIILDAAPHYVIPATISFVADVAQFTPKTVETANERAKLMFRIRAQIPADLLRQHITQVKTGLPGMAYVRLDPHQPWPSQLQVQLPP